MRSLLAAMLLVLVALAGCSDDGGSQPLENTDTGFEDIRVDVGESTGAILGIVVDDAVRPVPEATVTLRLQDGDRNQTTDAQGRFAFSDVPAGTHFLSIGKPGFKDAQVSVEVVAGDDRPPTRKVLLERLFSQDPFVTDFKVSGFVTCTYHAVLITAPCVTDYTSILPTCPGGCAPQLRDVQGDHRSFELAVDNGWQTLLFEMVWEASAQGTSEQLGITVSHTNRTAGHWYASADSPSPLALRINVGEPGPSPQNDGSGEDMIPEEGKPNILAFVNIGSEGDPVALGLNQEFELFAHTFYFAPAPEAWSFVAGDEPPF